MKALVLAWALFQGDDPIQNLRDTDPEVRAAAATIIGRKDMKSAIPHLIELLRMETNAYARSAAKDALERLTGLTGPKSYGEDYLKWKNWWTLEGSKTFPITNLTRQDIQDMLKPTADELEGRVKNAKIEIRMIGIFLAIVGILFVVIMIYFVGHVSSKLKEWKDLVRQAEAYLKTGEEITQRTDRILEELESKKSDILTFVQKQRDEVEAEIERYADIQQESAEHRMREEMMALRQKAEKELEQTLGDLRTQIDHEIRRTAGGQREALDREFKEQHAKFLQEVQSHTLFLEAEFLQIHGKPEEALRQYRKLVSLKPDHYVAWTHLGNVYRELTRFDEALEAYQKALALSPSDSKTLYNVAATFARLKKRDKMLEALSRAVANDGDYKDEALNDAAFRDYWKDPAFKDLAEG